MPLCSHLIQSTIMLHCAYATVSLFHTKYGCSALCLCHCVPVSYKVRLFCTVLMSLCPCFIQSTVVLHCAYVTVSLFHTKYGCSALCLCHCVPISYKARLCLCWNVLLKIYIVIRFSIDIIILYIIYIFENAPVKLFLPSEVIKCSGFLICGICFFD